LSGLLTSASPAWAWGGPCVNSLHTVWDTCRRPPRRVPDPRPPAPRLSL